jgi:DNA-binding NtrC family response regulator
MSDPTATNPLGTYEGVVHAREARGDGPQTSLVVFHAEQARVVRIFDGQTLVIGRDPSAEIFISDDSISRRHASFSFASGVVTVADLDSTNGTKLNGAAVQKAVINPGDEVTVGRVTVSLHVLAPAHAPRLGLATHDQFLMLLEDEVERARTFRRTATVVMVRHGGDPSTLASLLRRAIRTVDRLALYGDGTFELLLPECAAQEATRMMQELVPRLVSVQLGLAMYPADGSSAEALLEASRDAMHRASKERPIQGATVEVRVPTTGVGLVSISPAMKSIFATVNRVASAVMPVLIRGETGSGKEVLARAIHDQGPRAKHKLVSINCGAIPATLVESVLFGHERGAFTGATTSTRGIFEEADGSTVLLDEVGELSASAQAALLRVLETKEVRRVGSSRDVTVDVRVIAATHRDLEVMVKAGTFREDLMYRLNAMTLEVPPLRERPEEIGPFAERFVTLANAANGRDVKGLDAETMRLLLRYGWPGNIRELRNAVEHAVVVAQRPMVQAIDLPRRVREFAATMLQEEEPPPPAAPRPSAPAALAPAGDLREGVQRYETQLILEALRAAQGNRTEAARRLQIPVRTLSHKLKQYGIKKLGFGVDGESD